MGSRGHWLLNRAWPLVSSAGSSCGTRSWHPWSKGLKGTRGEVAWPRSHKGSLLLFFIGQTSHKSGAVVVWAVNSTSYGKRSGNTGVVTTPPQAAPAMSSPAFH